MIAEATEGRLCASMAAPVHDSGTVADSLGHAASDDLHLTAARFGSDPGESGGLWAPTPDLRVNAGIGMTMNDPRGDFPLAPSKVTGCEPERQVVTS
ncbi:hypothetical protein KIPE111705_10335 [Kibdelosporangium persicum]|uniref:hypothetical protein n=1 Tax=Kibdelosporangium persicum TaxID=2698649 RepID=UPI0015661517|nr:hypothetical protein [Kibdelosporangium persicum]